MKYISPEFLGEGFSCPTCDTYTHMDWSILSNRGKDSMFQEATCSRCKQVSLWHVLERQRHEIFGATDLSGVMVFPDRGSASPDEIDMPEDVKRDYEQAASIFNKSPRGAAALLRLGLQKLCKHLGERGKT